MAKAKVLSISELKKVDAKNYNSQKKIISNGYEIILDMKFRDSKIDAMLDELIVKISDASVEGVDIKPLRLLDFYIIKYFTNFGDSLEKSTFAQDIQVYTLLVDNKFLDDIFEVFNNECEDGLKKIFFKLDERQKFVNSMQQQLLQAHENEGSAELSEKIVENVEKIEIASGEEDGLHHLKRDKETDTISFVE